MASFKQGLVHGLLGLWTILLSLSLSIVTTIWASLGVFAGFSRWLDYPSLTGLSPEDLQESYQSMITYFFQPQVKYLQIPHFAMSAGGQEHFLDVRRLVWLVLVLLVLSLVGIWWSRKKHRIRPLLMRPILRLGQALPLLLLLTLLVGFDYLFVRFHELFFTNDLWIFDPLLDPIITVLPESFFFVLFILVLLFYELYLWLLSLRISK